MAMHRIFADLQKTLDDLYAELNARGVLLSHDDAMRILAQEFQRLTGMSDPENMN